MRFERKFLVAEISKPQMVSYVKLHPYIFKEIYNIRFVNNIYFDTPGLNHYFDNVDGEKSRLKVRIRWYGEMFGVISKPVLEFKIKNGLEVTKKLYILNDFKFDESFSKKIISVALGTPQIPASVCDELLSMNPVLLNRYSRNYFLSSDKQFRITIDNDLIYYRISYFNNTFLNKSIDRNSIVLEMKYKPEMDEEARKITTLFQFPLTKSSKYLQGLNRVFI